MHNITLPGFTAEASFGERQGIYATSGAMAAANRLAPVSPALGIDCYPMCVIFAEARCRRMCPPHSIDCLPICILMAENRCRQLCAGIGPLLPGLVAGPGPVAPGDPVEGASAAGLMA
jgi:hypothetical protein